MYIERKVTIKVHTYRRTIEKKRKMRYRSAESRFGIIAKRNVAKFKSDMKRSYITQEEQGSKINYLEVRRYEQT